MNAHQISLYGQIGESLFSDSNNSAKSVVDQIKAAGPLPIDLHIHSTGGSLFDGYTIYNALAAHQPGVTVYVDGLAASIAAYIAMAGKTVNIAENGMLMVHNPTMDPGRMDIKKMQKQMSLLDKVTKSYAEAFTRRGVLSAEQVSAMMDDETWMTADEALLAGLVDDITPEMQMAASVDVSELVNFRHVPDKLLAQAGTRPTKKQGAPQSPPKGYPTSRDQYADPENYKYPIDTAARTRSAWSYINKAENRSGYSAAELTYIENRIKSAARKFGIKIADDTSKESTSGNFDTQISNMSDVHQTITATSDPETQPKPQPEPAPAPEPEPVADASFIEKLKSLLQPKTELVTEITGLRSKIEVRDASIVILNAKVADLTAEVALYKAQAAQIPQIKALVEQLEKDKKSVEAAAADKVAALGFPQDKLPAQTEDKEDKSKPIDSNAILAKLNAIKDPKEFTLAYRAMEKEIRAALQAERIAAAKV